MNDIGVESLVIYSEADEGSAYIDEASSAVRMDGNRPDETYLNKEAILEIAKKHGADAIHPGYGFLSENASFARQVKNSGLLFIGPDPDLIEQMGEKVKGRETMAAHGFPVFSGSEALENKENIDELARGIGFPLVVKPSGGGGGIGMQVVSHLQDLSVAIARASSIAEKAFSDSSLYLEKWIDRPRHIEFQIIGDGKGGCVHAFDRECSVQRRHQKLIEESPSPGLDETMLNERAELAAEVCRKIKYGSLGTLETLFLQNGEMGFLEMNTRIQVEHGVTEEVIGLDLVKLQLSLMAGRPLPDQQDIVRKGFAIEARLYAEDPDSMFPSTGRLETFRPPEMFGVRVETGYQRGQAITPYYDPLLAKVIAKGNTREQAIGRLSVALRAFDVSGVKTNAALLQKVLNSDEFLKGNIDTGLLDRL
tara:strand:- start:1394 stop:2659 length:1266 start_codon:yes stop_codon:yes gene_type:complete